MKPSDNKPRQYGGLVFDFASTGAGVTSTAMVKNNRNQPIVLTDICAVCLGGANSHLDWQLQARDQSTGQEWFSSAVQLAALLGAGANSGVLAGDQGTAPQAPVKLASAYVLAPGAQLQLSATNNGTNSVPLSILLSGFYLGAG
jgi:hypothetical protein